MYNDGSYESCNGDYDDEFVSGSADNGRRRGCCRNSCSRHRCHRRRCCRGNRILYWRDTYNSESNYREIYHQHGTIGLSFFLADKLYQAGKKYYEAKKESRAREFVSDAENDTASPDDTYHSDSSSLTKSEANVADTHAQCEPQPEVQHMLNKRDTSPPPYTEKAQPPWV